MEDTSLTNQAPLHCTFPVAESLLHEVCLAVFATPSLPTESHRRAGEVNFQQPPEFLLTFLGVFVT